MPRRVPYAPFPDMTDMLRFTIAFLLALSGLAGCTPALAPAPAVPSFQGPTNRLAHENSPYLLRHAQSPVNWYPWGQEALQQAQQAGKPLLVSIGYTACHWCHVMEEESFRDPEVAALMNASFVNVLVDREERPDLDNLFMEASQLLTGTGGWPLQVMLLPDGRPFFASTYLAKADWLRLLQRIDRLYREDRLKLQSIAEQLTAGLKQVDLAGVGLQPSNKPFTRAEAATAVKTWKALFDPEAGGYRRVPKFPLPANHSTLLAYYHFSQDAEVLAHVKRTLDELAASALHDHIGGGFARYASDSAWQVPHFEKMLYDNAQLASLYAQAYQVTKKAGYRQVAMSVLGFMERELRHKEGGFYASVDADAAGEEGHVYLWETAEVDALLGNDALVCRQFFQMKPEGNWSGRGNVLRAPYGTDWLANTLQLPEPLAEARLEGWKKTLLKARNLRAQSNIDRKSLAAWNALAINAYLDGYFAFQQPQYLKTAVGAGHFLLKKLTAGGYGLKRSYLNGKASIEGFIDDYACTIQAFLKLYEATLDPQWLTHAQGLLDYTLQHFRDPKSGYFYFASDIGFGLIVRKIELADHVLPSSNAQMAQNLFLLGHYLSKPEYLSMSRRMLAGMQERMKEDPSFYASWWTLHLLEAYPFYEVAVVGKDAERVRKSLHQLYLPHKVVAAAKEEGSLPILAGKLRPGQTTIYVCEEGSCKKPVTSVQEAVGQLRIR
jgi:hypothetical protein